MVQLTFINSWLVHHIEPTKEQDCPHAVRVGPHLSNSSLIMTRAAKLVAYPHANGEAKVDSIGKSAGRKKT